jgi:oxygen-independent coproporphyrinogen-3 oxidase
MEMNPGVTDAAALRELRAAGITRASLGVQSTHDRLLQGLGRDHSAEDARQAFRDARAAGFDNVNVDLMFAVPGQSLADWDETLAEVASWAPEHVSAYNLTAKDQTPLAAQVARGEIVLPGEAKQHAMFERAHGMLTAAGYEHVEISNYAKPGRACVHNGDVWRGEPYLGIGLGAHSCFGGERFWNTAAWDEYFKAIAAGEMPTRVDEDRDDAGKLLEDVYLGLRTREGVDFAAMKSRHGVDLLATRANAVKDLVEEGLAALENGSLRLTLKGWAVTDAVVTALV